MIRCLADDPIRQKDNLPAFPVSTPVVVDPFRMIQIRLVQVDITADKQQGSLPRASAITGDVMGEIAGTGNTDHVRIDMGENLEGIGTPPVFDFP